MNSGLLNLLSLFRSFFRHKSRTRDFVSCSHDLYCRRREDEISLSKDDLNNMFDKVITIKNRYKLGLATNI